MIAFTFPAKAFWFFGAVSLEIGCALSGRDKLRKKMREQIFPGYP